MAVLVSFASVAGAESVTVQLISDVRATENLDIGDTTTAAAQGREIAVIVNAEAEPIMAAWGSAPDADATMKTAATTAGICIPSGQSLIAFLKPNDKINVEVIA